MQTYIVIAIIAAALVYAGIVLTRRVKAFSPNRNCADDCGCPARSGDNL